MCVLYNIIIIISVDFRDLYMILYTGISEMFNGQWIKRPLNVHDVVKSRTFWNCCKGGIG